MGRYTIRRHIYYDPIFYYDPYCLWAILYALHLYSHLSYSLSASAGEATQNIAYTFMKSYAGVCLEGAMIVLACVIFSAFASAPPVIDTDASAVSMLWSYIGEIVFNMLILVGTVKMSDRLVKDMMGI